MGISAQHVTGFFVGVGVAASAYYLYRKNQTKVDAFLLRHGIQVPKRAAPDPSSLSLEELVAHKERLEDLIAERQHAAGSLAAS